MLWRAAVALLFVALLGPKVGSKIENIETKGIDLMIALDVSNSMLAEDLKPNRMAHSKRAIEQIIRELQGNRIGLVIFAGNAYVQLPLTTDVTSAKVFLDAVHPGIVPTQGTAIGAAIDLCMDSFDQTSTAGRMILLITDGENHEDDAVSAAKQAHEAGVKVCAIGAGAPGGAPIPNYNNRGNRTGFKTDNAGNTIVSALNENLLVEIVDAGNGVFVRSTPTTVNLGLIRDAMNELEKGDLGEASFTDHRHLFPYFLFAALGLILIEMLIAERKWKRKLNWV
jgi:Ca-activated chloride channel family protein